MPALNNYHKEAGVIGRLLIGYGEIEFALAHCVSMILNDPDRVFKAMFSKRGETKRVKTAETLAQSGSMPTAYMTMFGNTLDDVKHCLAIRNQYAHCVWLENYSFGLSFVNLEEIAVQPAIIDLGNLTQHQALPALLDEQDAFFAYVDSSLSYLNFEAQFLGKRIRQNGFPKPATLARPATKIVSPKPEPLVNLTRR